MSDTMKHFVTPLARGTTTVTAMADGLAADATITVYAGRHLPSGVWRWRIGPIGVVETPGSETSTATDDAPIMLFDDGPAFFVRTWSVHARSGLVEWSERSAIDNAEIVGAQKLQPIGGGLLVVDSKDGLHSALVRQQTTERR
jgi:hypothetical protein